MTSSMIRPLKRQGDWKKCVKNNRTITIKHGKIVHKFTKNILHDPQDTEGSVTNGYLETYFLDEESQLEKRLAIGDSSFLENLKEEDREVMKEVIKDIQSQLLTHNGFVKQIRDYRKKTFEKMDSEMKDFEKQFDEENMTQFDRDAYEKFNVETWDEHARLESNPLLKIPVDKQKRDDLRNALIEKKKFLTEKREIIKEKLMDNIELAIHQPIKNPTTIQERTLNDPRSGVPISFIPMDQPNKPRATFYRCTPDKENESEQKKENSKLQAISEINPEYDLLSYPLFFPEGNEHQFGWGQHIPFVLNKRQLIDSDFERIKTHLSKDEIKNANTNAKKVKLISKVLKIKNLQQKDYNYKQYLSMKDRSFYSMREWYNFLLQERAGFIKRQVFTPKQELHQYHFECNKKLKKEDRVKILTDNHVFKDEIKFGNKTFKLQVHPESRVPFIIENGIEKAIDPNRNNDPDSLREPEKKNPILYGERLKLFWLCDQGLKVDNNDVRYKGKEIIQKKMRQVDLKTQRKLKKNNQDVNEEGDPKVLASNQKKSKKWYNKQYLNAIANSLNFDGYDLFVTGTGDDKSPELRSLHDGRTPGTCPELTNRLFRLKMKEIMKDIFDKQIFGRVVGRVWVIEYQKR